MDSFVIMVMKENRSVLTATIPPEYGPAPLFSGDFIVPLWLVNDTISCVFCDGESMMNFVFEDRDLSYRIQFNFWKKILMKHQPDYIKFDEVFVQILQTKNLRLVILLFLRNSTRWCYFFFCVYANAIMWLDLDSNLM